ncbi:MAG: Stk1 family PASTA domain-containing Ser/Thr kinase [Sporichthyaceae bacterium]|nr:Stk1 family PASTA domain-containing Ser/Thr kinase [Sporichthyaceae bacterium]
MDQPRLVGGRYELSGVLGRGGMAEVHMGRDIRLGRNVAVKTLRADLSGDATFQARFRREAQSAASLNHPAIVAVYDTGEDTIDGMSLPYIVMEYVEGSTLRDLLQSGRRLLPERAIEITAGVLQALEYSHRNGIVHRDIKPGNVMLTRSGAVKVMDFGIARAVADVGATMTATSAVIGTAQYLSPEQAKGEHVDARSDLYSAGCLLYELLTGRPPFVGDSPVSVAYQHVRETAQPPSYFDDEVSPDLDAVVMKALAKDPDDRYQTADEMRADLDRVLDGRPVMARSAAAGMGYEATRNLPMQRPAAGMPTQVIHPTQVVPAGPGGPPRPYQQGPPGPPPRRGSTYALIALAVVAVFVLATLFGRALLGGSDAKKVVVPPVIGQTVEQAESTLQTVGFQTVVDESCAEFSDHPKGSVVRQTPAASAEADEGSLVTLCTSKGQDLVPIPRVRGLSRNDAVAALEDAGFVVAPEIRQVPDANIAEGRAVRTEPKVGEEINRGSTVILFISSGPRMVEVENVVGRSVEDATQILTDQGFEVEVEEVEDPGPPGVVLQQDPEAGASIAAGSTVRLTVSKAPAPLPVPNVVGLSEDDATDTLHDSNFEVAVNCAVDPAGVGNVTAQNPGEGAFLPPGQTVTITVTRPVC